MNKLRSVALALAFSLPLLAQNHPYPGSVDAPPVICTGCGGTNSVGELNDGKPTMPYDVPVIAHVGRYVDSTSTSTVQHQGMRTVRAGMIRPNLANGRVYVKLGSTIGAYDLETFFTGRLAEPMVPVSVMVTGSRYLRNPLENVARPDGFVYPEAVQSGWQTPLVDSTERLEDIDVDDRGHVYYRSNVFGWGIHKDDGRTDGRTLPFVVQMPEPARGSTSLTLFTIKVAVVDAFKYYAYVSDAEKAQLFDVTVPATPVQVGGNRSGSANLVREWAKNDGEGHVAVITAAGALRIYTHAALLDAGAPLVEHVPDSGRTLKGMAFDEEGNLWIGESGGTSAGTLWKFAAGSYEKTAFTLPGNVFRPESLHAAGGHVAVAGDELVASVRRRDLILLEVVNGVPEPVATGNWFRHYYHAAPSGYAQPKSFTNTAVRPFLFVQDGLTYLFYSAWGLGDVFELGSELRPPNMRIISISPNTGSVAGGTVVTVNGQNFGQDAVVSFGGTAATTTYVSANQLTAVAPAHTVGAVTVYVSSNGQVATGPKFTYSLSAPSGFSATGTSDSDVLLAWNAAPGAGSYEVFLMNPDRTFSKVGSTTALSFNHGGRVPAMAYVYYVRALDAVGHPSLASNRDAATTVQFTDATIVPGMKIRGRHMSEIRIAVNRLRLAAGLSQLNWTSSIKVLAQQVEELRAALMEARAVSGLSAAPFTDASLDGVAIKAAHMQELMNAVR